MARRTQRAHDFDGREGICHDLMAERYAADRAILRDGFHFRERGIHRDSFLRKRVW